MGLITGSLDQGDFAEADMVVEAVFEDMELKQSVFADLDTICRARRHPGLQHLGPRTSTRSPPPPPGPRP